MAAPCHQKGSSSSGLTGATRTPLGPLLTVSGTIGISEKLTRHLPAARDSFPTGDFRDWDTITAWAEQVATDLDNT